ncbi:hypothetical protein NDU88_003838 [Pleurodeles waltl]|uniref:Uncharacterized protein n=1 Tax=Pleurodeles waltl TaxID=8319 RepID=A0AAV7SH54_PLEWA|nr:hypothetical protein NDU88_003838 [Pleurodeles waltl]
MSEVANSPVSQCPDSTSSSPLQRLAQSSSVQLVAGYPSTFAPVVCQPLPRPASNPCPYLQLTLLTSLQPYAHSRGETGVPSQRHTPPSTPRVMPSAQSASRYACFCPIPLPRRIPQHVRLQESCGGVPSRLVLISEGSAPHPLPTKPPQRIQQCPPSGPRNIRTHAERTKATPRCAADTYLHSPPSGHRSASGPGRAAGPGLAQPHPRPTPHTIRTQHRVGVSNPQHPSLEFRLHTAEPTELATGKSQVMVPKIPKEIRRISPVQVLPGPALPAMCSAPLGDRERRLVLWRCPVLDEYHPYKGSLHSEEEEQLEDSFWVLTLALGRKEGPDLETASSQWQPEAEPGENSDERPEDEQMLGHLRGSTGSEEEGWNLLWCDPEQEITKREQPKADKGVTQEAVCRGAASFRHA